MSEGERTEEDIAREMAEHHLALSALWRELAAAKGRRKKQPKGPTDIVQLRRRLDRIANNNGKA